MRDTVSPLYGANLSIAAFLKQPVQWKNRRAGRPLLLFMSGQRD
jgi:hypothetical protein